MLPPTARSRALELSSERIRLPFDGNPVIKVFLDEDGRYYTNHPLLEGRFANRKQIGDRIRTLRDMFQFINRPPVVMPPPPPMAMQPQQPSPLQCENLVAGAGDASALTVEAQDVSCLEVFPDTKPFEVSTTAHSGTASQHTSSLSCEKLMSCAAEFASGQALQDPDVASLKEESITAGPQTVPYNTIDGSSSTFPSSCDKFVVGATECIPTVTQQDSLVSRLNKLIDKVTHKFHGSSSEESSTATPRTVLHYNSSGSPQSASPIGSQILMRLPPGCLKPFYIRMDWRGAFCNYPDVGGPFDSIDEADDAMKHFLDEQRNGGRMKHDCKTTYVQERYLIQALLDQYNGDDNLCGDHAHELEDLVRMQLILENHRWYFHFNFTTKQGTSDKLFFAELSYQGAKEMAWKVNCCRIIDTENNDGGGHCYGCKNNGNPDMQHPNDTSAYIGGHLDVCYPYGRWFTKSDDEGDDDEDDDDETILILQDDHDDVDDDVLELQSVGVFYRHRLVIVFCASRLRMCAKMTREVYWFGQNVPTSSSRIIRVSAPGSVCSRGLQTGRERESSPKSLMFVLCALCSRF